MPRTGPSILIRLELECAPAVLVDVMDDAEEKRLAFWLTDAHPEYGELAQRAIDLEQEKAA